MTVQRDGEDWDISGEGRKLTIDAEIWQVLDQPISSDLLPPPSRVQFALLAKEAAISGRRARLSLSADRQQFTLSLTRA